MSERSIGYNVGFELRGIQPLLMHYDNIEGGDELKEWRQDGDNRAKSVAGDDRSPAWTWHTYLYHDSEFVTMPSDNIMSALMNGGAKVILKKQKTYKELSQSGILIAQEHCEFRYDGNRQLSWLQVLKLRTDDISFVEQSRIAKELGFRLFSKRAKIGQAKHVRVRPRFENWSVKGELRVVTNDLPFETLERIFSYAGEAGLCDWRPSSPKRPGSYGMFTAHLVKLP